MSPVVTLVVDLLVVVVTAYGYRLWLVVAQQEAFDPRRVLGVVRLWWRVVPLTAVQAGLVVLLGVGGLFATYTAIVAAVIGLFATPAFDKGWAAGELVRTPRARRVVRLVAVLHLAAGVVLALLGAISLLPLLVLPVVLLALRMTRTSEPEAQPSTGSRPDRVRRAPDRPVVVDDSTVTTAEPAREGTAEAVATAAPGAVVWTITPGLFGLGTEQDAGNRELGRRATDGERMRLAVVGRTHRHALRVGAEDTTGQVELFATRDQALAHVLAETGPADVVHLLGELPPHLP